MVVSLGFSTTQTFLASFGTDWLTAKTGKEIKIASLDIGLFSGIEIKNIYIEDNNKDTLLYAGEISLDMNLFSAAFGDISPSLIALTDVVAKLKLDKDTVYNFDYLIDAFASDDNTKTDTSTQSIDINLNNLPLELNNCKFVYYSDVDGIDLYVNAGNLELVTDSIGLKQMYFSSKDISLSDVIVNLDITKETDEIESDTTEMDDIFIKTGRTDFKNISFNMDYVPGEMKLFSELKSGYIIPKIIDIKNGKYFAKQAELNGANVGIEFYGKYEPNIDIDTSDYGLIVLVPDVGVEAGSDKISLSGGEFSLDYTNYPKIQNSFDVNHLHYSGLNLVASNAAYLKNKMHADIIEASGDIPNTNLKIKDFKSKATITNNSINLTGLKMQSNESYLTGSFNISYNKFNDIISTKPKFNKLFVDMDTAKIAMSEVDYFYNIDTILNLNKIDKKQISISTNIAGNGTKLNINKLNIDIFDNSQISTAGIIENINNFDSLKYNLDLTTLKLTKTEIGTVLPDSLPKYFNYLLARGELSGDLTSINTKLKTFSDVGEIDIDLALKDSSYKAELQLIKQNYSAVFEDSIKLYDLYAKLNIQGDGFDYKTNAFNLEMQIDSANFNKEELTDINLKLTADNGKYKTIIISENEKLNLKSYIDFSVKDSIYEFIAKSNIKNIDLQWLGVVDEKASVKVNVNAAYKGKTLDSLTANISLNNLKLNYKQDYILNNLNTNIEINDSLTNIDLTSDYISGFVRSNFNVKETQKYFLSFVEDYFNKNDTSKKYNSKISFAFDINDENLVRANLVDGLTSIQTSKIIGEFNSENYSFNLNANVWDFTYNEIKGDTIAIDFTTNDDIINYLIDLKKVNLTDSFFVDNLKMKGIINRDSLSFEFLDNEQDYMKYYFGASYTIKDSLSRISLFPEIIFDSLIFDVNKDNYVEFSKNYLKFGEVSISNKDQKIYIKPSVENGDLDLLVENLDLILLSKNNFIKDEMFSGILNANAKINLDGNGEINADIENLKVYDGDYGKFELKAELNKWKYKIKSTIKGNYADIDFSGGNNPEIYVNTKINKLDLSLLETVVADISDSLVGDISGNIRIEKNKEFSFNGNLDFNNVKFKSKIRSAVLSIDKQEINFSDNTIAFNNFTISDIDNNKFIMNGRLYDLDFDYFKADIHLTADDFSFYDATKEQNERLYGKIIIDNDTKITGDIDNLVINSNIKFLKGTKITYVYPETEMVSLEKPDGIVEFIVPVQDSSLVKDTVVDFWLSNMVLKSNVVIDKNTEVNIVFNDIAGENISVVGGGNINLDIDEGGNINLFGQYKIEEGFYDLSYYEIVKRKFNLKKGSRIFWTGDPYNPTADIVATYRIRTNPYPLMVTSGLSEAEMTKYKLNQIFNVNLSIQGMMMYPEMGFTIEYPRISQNSNDQTLHSKINMINSDPNKANKQAISLLIMSSFVTDDGNTVNGGETFVNNSISGLLTSQLNKYSSKFIKGVDFDFDVNRFSTYDNSSNADGAQTDVKIKMKKTMFNDRVVVEVAGGVSMENENNNSGNSSIHDAAIEYLITKDGRYKLRVFSEKDYTTINNDVQSSGLSVVYTTEFDDITEMFKREAVEIKEEEEEIKEE